MKRTHYIQLIYKYFKGESSPEEKAELDKWLDDSVENRVLKSKVEQDWKLSEQFNPDLDIDVNADFELLRQRVRKEKGEQITPPKIRSINSHRRWMAIAATVALVIAAGWWFTNNGTIEQSLQIAQTAIGEKREIILADGSKIWLNENSHLTFPSAFSATARKVKLEGEAFFEIEKNPSAPFIIELNEANITVLGTSFNINARAKNPQLTVSVRTGKVRLQSNENQEILILIKDEKGLLNVKNHQLSKQENVHPNDFAWQTGVLRFKGQPLEEVINIINEFYKGKAIITQASMRQCLFDGRLQEKNLQNALAYIADAFQMTLTQKSATRFELSNGVCQ